MTSDKLLEENPDLVRRFVAAIHETFTWAKDNPEETCKLHVERVPEVAMDDCLGSLEATLGFVFNDHSEATGLGNYDPERLAFTWDVVAEAQELDPAWDPTNAIDTSLAD